MKVIKKHAFTLLEVLLSLSLFAFVLFFFFSHLKSSIKTKYKLIKMQDIVYKRAYINQRLSDLLSKIELALDHYDLRGRSCFYTEAHNEEMAAYFLLDLGIDKDPNFCGLVQAKLYLSKNHEIKLDLFSTQNPELAPREEILLEHVQDLTMEFFAMPNPFDQDKKKIYPNYEKKQNWELSETQIPAIFRLHITCEAENFTYSFFPNSKIKEIVFER